MAPALSKLKPSIPLAVGVSLVFIGLAGVIFYVISSNEDSKDGDCEDEGMILN